MANKLWLMLRLVKMLERKDEMSNVLTSTKNSMLSGGTMRNDFKFEAPGRSVKSKQTTILTHQAHTEEDKRIRKRSKRKEWADGKF